MKTFSGRVALVLVSFLLSGCASKSTTPEYGTLRDDLIADAWEKTCQELPSSASCHDAADKIRNKKSIYGMYIGGDTFRVTVSSPIPDECFISSNSDICKALYLLRTTASPYDVRCIREGFLGPICYAHVAVTNITKSPLRLRLNAQLTNKSGIKFEPNVTESIKLNQVIDLNFTPTFDEKLNPGQTEYWDLAFKIGDSQVNEFSSILFERIEISDWDFIYLIPAEGSDDTQIYEEAWYTDSEFIKDPDITKDLQFIRKKLG